MTTTHVRRSLAGLHAAYEDAFGPGGLAFASPQVALIGSFVIAYGVGLPIASRAVGQNVTTIAVAVAVGLVSMLAGIAVAWRTGRQTVRVAPRRGAPRWLFGLGGGLVIVGTVSMAAYLWRIGGIPLLMPSSESARVTAAEAGGAALRVLTLLSLAGVWLIVAWALWQRRGVLPVVAIGLVLLTAGLQILTANRSPAFQAIVVATLIGMLAAGLKRLRVGGLMVLVSLGVALILAAGAVGAIRLASAPPYGPPVPGQPIPTPRKDYVGLTLVAIRGYSAVPVQNFGYTLDAVPTQLGWRFGYSYLQPLLTVLPGKQTTFDQDLKAALGQRYAGGGTVPSLLGEAYANFGPIGWVVVPFGVAWVVGWLYRFASQRERPALWALYGYALFHACSATVSGLLVASVFPYVAYGILVSAVVVDLGLARVAWPFRRGARSERRDRTP